MDVTYVCIDIVFISNVNVFGVYQNLRKVFINSIQFILPAYIKFVNMISFLIIWKYVTSLIINSIELKVKSYSQVTQELSAFLFFDTLFYNILYVYQTLNSSISVLWTSSRCIRGTLVNVCCISSKILFYFQMKNIDIFLNLPYCIWNNYIRNYSLLYIDKNEVEFSNKNVFEKYSKLS